MVKANVPCSRHKRAWQERDVVRALSLYRPRPGCAPHQRWDRIRVDVQETCDPRHTVDLLPCPRQQPSRHFRSLRGRDSRLQSQRLLGR
ncbi:hypothetical protein LINGRAHAP2_LOCUS12968 [Linum grandiflorum]